MVELDKEKCVVCGRCRLICPTKAIHCFGYPEINPDICSDCRGGKSVTEPTDKLNRRACVEYCPVGALSAKVQ